MGFAKVVNNWLSGNPAAHREGADFLSLRPRRLVEHEMADDAENPEQGALVVLLIPRFRSGLMGRFLQPRIRADKKFIRAKLESRGSWIWETIDGRLTVAELVDGFEVEFADDAEDARERVAQYLLNLERNRFVELVVGDS